MCEYVYVDCFEDRYNPDSLLATGVVQVEQFSSGFDGMIPLSMAGDKRNRSKKQAMPLGRGQAKRLKNMRSRPTGIRLGSSKIM